MVRLTRSDTAILSPDECGFNVAHFPIVDVVVMATDGESVACCCCQVHT